jgi:hypothetical protein
MICVLVGVGAARRWLNSYEVFFAIGLIAIPYFTRAFEMCMASQGRFVSVVFPAFIVLARLLSVSPYGVGLLWLTVSGVLQLLYAALFAAGYLII